VRNKLQLVLISFAALFLELVVIRWLSTEVRIFAYFKNLPLMAAFLGFGVGCFLYQHADNLFYRWFPRLVAALVTLIVLAPLIGITHVIFADPRQFFFLGAGFGDHDSNSAVSILESAKALAVIVGIFFLVMATFSALTSKMGQLLNREKPLSGYSINVVGSLLGIAGFSVVSYFEWPPTVWLFVAYLSLAYFFWRHSAAARAILCFSLSWTVAFYMGKSVPARWSPYYRVMTSAFGNDGPYGVGVSVNYDGFQAIQLLTPEHIGKFPVQTQKVFNRHYNLPYKLSRKPIESVLILGGGTGNDAAAALRNGATRVDVVEIDPVIARLGRELHPEHPYSSNHVQLHIDDARSFLQKTKDKYDLVVFATLDSHTAFSSLSSLRLDNFVFTKDSIEEVAGKLNQGGGIAINFFAINPWLSQRHVNTLEAAMGASPLAFGSAEGSEVLLLAGGLFDAKRDLGITNYQPMNLPFTTAKVEPTTDDWPFLFLEQRGISLQYVLPLLIIFLVSLAPFRYCQVKAGGMNWHLFFMGASFLLIETKSVTALGLLFGSTWMVNSVVIGSILVMILLANSMVARRVGPSITTLYGVLLALLTVNFFFPLDLLNGLPWSQRVLAAGLLVSAPLFVAAMIFAQAFKAVQFPSVALASNLFGALVGGLLEYADMLTGLRWLNIIALLLYFVSYVALVRPQALTASRTEERALTAQ
jgi:hypothetical protein